MFRIVSSRFFVVLNVVLAMASPLELLAEGPRKAVLLDTDIGSTLDDAIALSVLLSSPGIDLKAITTSGGDCEDRAWIVCRLLSMIGRNQIPVAWGRDPQPPGEVKEMFQYRYHPAVLFNRTARPLADKDAADLLPKGAELLIDDLLVFEP